AVLHVDVVGRVDLGDQVVGHALRERLAADEDRDAGRELREVQGRLSGGVTAANDEDLLTGQCRRLGDGGAVVDTNAVERVEGRNIKRAIRHSGCDHYRAARDFRPVGELHDPQVAVDPQARGAFAVDHLCPEQDG